LDDAAGVAELRLGVPLGHVDALDDDPRFRRQHAQDLAGPTLVAAADDDDVVALLDLQLRHPHSTSGASDTIFMNRRARNSRVTGPKMRVPIGSPPHVARTAPAAGTP